MRRDHYSLRISAVSLNLEIVFSWISVALLRLNRLR